MSFADELSALARKYRTLLALRREHEQTGEVAEREALRALSREFPGALRELDRMPLDEIERRARALEAASRTRCGEPWMQWLVAYHALVRAALFIKSQRLEDQGASEEEVARAASIHARVDVSAAFVREIRRPREGRISRTVLQELSERFETPPQQIQSVIKAPSRPGQPKGHCR